MVDVKQINVIKGNLMNKMKEIFKTQGRLDAMAIIINSDGKFIFVPMPFKSIEEKHLMIDGVKAICKTHDPVAVCIINEAWMIVTQDMTMRKQLRDSGKSISDMPDKKECVVMIFETNFSQDMACFDIDRTSNELINEVRSDNATGTFCNLLTPVNKN